MALSQTKNNCLNPVSIALRHTTETRRLLERLITSSESFDYPSAKLALEHLASKAKELKQFESELALTLYQESRAQSITIVPFSS